jgi:hypothetical protein
MISEKLSKILSQVETAGGGIIQFTVYEGSPLDDPEGELSVTGLEDLDENYPWYADLDDELPALWTALVTPKAPAATHASGSLMVHLPGRTIDLEVDYAVHLEWTELLTVKVDHVTALKAQLS